MNGRMKKKVHNREVDERLDALEELTRRMAAEQTRQRERADELEDDLFRYQQAVNNAMRKAYERRARRERIRLEREAERRRFRRGWAKCAAMLAVAVSFLMFALMLPSPERIEPVSTAEPMAVAADPAEGVVEAVVLSWEG